MKHTVSFVDFSHSLLANSGAQSSLLIRFLLLPLIRSVLSNMHEMEQMLVESEDLNWTVVRPPGLRNLPSTGRLGNSSWFFVRHRKRKPLCLKPDQCCWRESHEKPGTFIFLSKTFLVTNGYHDTRVTLHLAFCASEFVLTQFRVFIWFNPG